MSYGGGMGSQSAGSGDKKSLNPEQMQHLFNKISSDEQKELQEIMARCTSEVTMTRGLPFAAVVVGSLYFARTRLPPQYHFGPKGWPFYAIMGIGSLTAANIFGMGMCRDRVQPKIHELWNKYQLSDARTNYDMLRARNRQLAHEQHPRELSLQPYESSEDQPAEMPSPSRAPARPRHQYGEEPSIMSGTPVGRADAPPPGMWGSGTPQGRAPKGPNPKANQYGDEGFS